MSIWRFLFSFQGRITRALWWRYWVLYLAIYVCFCAFALRSGHRLLPLACWVVTLYPTLAVCAKRCHDRGRSGWFTLVALVPILGLWYFVEVALLPGTDGPNEYGAGAEGGAGATIGLTTIVVVLVALGVSSALVSAAYYFKVERSPQVHMERSMALRSKGHYDQAESEIRRSIQLEPGSAEAHKILGSLLEIGGDARGAIAEYEEALQLKPDYAEVRYILAQDLFAKGDKEGAKAQYKMLTTPSTPSGLDAFLRSELPFQKTPKQIFLLKGGAPGVNPIVLSIFTKREPICPPFSINLESADSKTLGPKLRDIFQTRGERVIWVRFADGLPPFTGFMRVMEILRGAGIDSVNLILNSSEELAGFHTLCEW